MSTRGREMLVAAYFGVAVLACGARHERLPQQAVPPVEPPPPQAGECARLECPPVTDRNGKPYTYIHPKTQMVTELDVEPGPLATCPDGHSMYGYTGRCLRNPDKSCSWEVLKCPAGGGSAQ
jgi:hypothetical protein